MDVNAKHKVVVVAGYLHRVLHASTNERAPAVAELHVMGREADVLEVKIWGQGAIQLQLNAVMGPYLFVGALKLSEWFTIVRCNASQSAALVVFHGCSVCAYCAWSIMIVSPSVQRLVGCHGADAKDNAASKMELHCNSPYFGVSLTGPLATLCERHAMRGTLSAAGGGALTWVVVVSELLM